MAEGGSQRVASILADTYRAGFKEEFKSWLASVSRFPKGYDFKFGELSELVNLNWRGLLTNEFTPCWRLHDLTEVDGELFYTATTRNKEGELKVEQRPCGY